MCSGLVDFQNQVPSVTPKNSVTRQNLDLFSLKIENVWIHLLSWASERVTVYEFELRDR